jgi:CTP synthase (UTP-ammonia lyase)
MSSGALRVAILGEYSASLETHRFTEAAFGHSAASLGLSVEWKWISTAEMSDALLLEHDALFVATGGPYKDLDRGLAGIKAAREKGIPCLGTCGGFQHMVVEYARHILAIPNAHHAEYDPMGEGLVISPLSCSLKGKTLRISLVAGARATKLYDSLTVEERYYCSFGINPDYASAFLASSFRPIGFDEEGAIRVMEIVGHPFYVGTLFVPQARSTAAMPHPLISGFLWAAHQRKWNAANT